MLIKVLPIMRRWWFARPVYVVSGVWAWLALQTWLCVCLGVVVVVAGLGVAGGMCVDLTSVVQLYLGRKSALLSTLRSLLRSLLLSLLSKTAAATASQVGTAVADLLFLLTLFSKNRSHFS